MFGMGCPATEVAGYICEACLRRLGAIPRRRSLQFLARGFNRRAMRQAAVDR